MSTPLAYSSCNWTQREGERNKSLLLLCQQVSKVIISSSSTCRPQSSQTLWKTMHAKMIVQQWSILYSRPCKSFLNLACHACTTWQTTCVTAIFSACFVARRGREFKCFQNDNVSSKEIIRCLSFNFGGVSILYFFYIIWFLYKLVWVPLSLNLGSNFQDGLGVNSQICQDVFLVSKWINELKEKAIGDLRLEYHFVCWCWQWQ